MNRKSASTFTGRLGQGDLLVMDGAMGTELLRSRPLRGGQLYRPVGLRAIVDLESLFAKTGAMAIKYDLYATRKR